MSERTTTVSPDETYYDCALCGYAARVDRERGLCPLCGERPAQQSRPAPSLD